MNTKIKSHISEKRHELNMTQNEVARQVGISVTAYRDLESGKTQILNEKVQRIAQVFDISTEELVLGYTPSQEESSRLKEERQKYQDTIKEKLSFYEEKIELQSTVINNLHRLLEKSEEIIQNKDQIISFQKKIIDGHN